MRMLNLRNNFSIKEATASNLCKSEILKITKGIELSFDNALPANQQCKSAKHYGFKNARQVIDFFQVDTPKQDLSSNKLYAIYALAKGPLTNEIHYFRLHPDLMIVFNL